jgi:hypothetical protein
VAIANVSVIIDIVINITTANCAIRVPRSKVLTLHRALKSW